MQRDRAELAEEREGSGGVRFELEVVRLRRCGVQRRSEDEDEEESLQHQEMKRAAADPSWNYQCCESNRLRQKPRRQTR